MIKKKKANQANHHGYICEESDTSLRRPSGKSFRRGRKRRSYPRTRQFHVRYCPWRPSVSQDVEVEDGEIDDSDPMCLG